MDVSKWPIGRIMQLPDHCFGRRFMVSVAKFQGADTRGWDISEVALPDVAVIYELTMWAVGGFGKEVDVRLALGDQLPTNTGEMDLLEPLFMGLGLQGPEPRYIRLNANQTVHLDRVKVPVMAQGRRLVLEVLTPAVVIMVVGVAIVVSGVPKEVPDCLISV